MRVWIKVILTGVWAHLENWIVQEGEIPELRTGATLGGHALRASCWSIQESSAPEGVSELPGLDPSGDNAPHYELTGTVEWGQEPRSVLLRVSGFRVLAEPISVRQVPETSQRNYALERFSPDFFVPAAGTRVTVVCRLEVMADYEADAFGFPDSRHDWLIRHLKLQHRALVPVPQLGRHAFKVDNVLRVDNIERMRRWADENGEDHVTYLLDLELPT